MPSKKFSVCIMLFESYTIIGKFKRDRELRRYLLSKVLPIHGKIMVEYGTPLVAIHIYIMEFVSPLCINSVYGMVQYHDLSQYGVCIHDACSPRTRTVRLYRCRNPTSITVANSHPTVLPFLPHLNVAFT